MLKYNSYAACFVVVSGVPAFPAWHNFHRALLEWRSLMSWLLLSPVTSHQCMHLLP